MTKKHDKQMRNLTIIGIIVALATIAVAVCIAKGCFDSPDISYNAYLIGSDSITINQPEFGLQFMNNGKKEGTINVKVSSNNENVSFVEDELSRWVYPKKTNSDYVDIEFSVNKSLFETKTENFTITFEIFYNGRNKQIVSWNYYRDCPYAYSNCMYRWVE